MKSFGAVFAIGVLASPVLAGCAAGETTTANEPTHDAPNAAHSVFDAFAGADVSEISPIAFTDRAWTFAWRHGSATRVVVEHDQYTESANWFSDLSHPAETTIDDEVHASADGRDAYIQWFNASGYTRVRRALLADFVFAEVGSFVPDESSGATHACDSYASSPWGIGLVRDAKVVGVYHFVSPHFETTVCDFGNVTSGEKSARTVAVVHPSGLSLSVKIGDDGTAIDGYDPDNAGVVKRRWHEHTAISQWKPLQKQVQVP